MHENSPQIYFNKQPSNLFLPFLITKHSNRKCDDLHGGRSNFLERNVFVSSSHIYDGFAKLYTTLASHTLHERGNQNKISKMS